MGEVLDEVIRSMGLRVETEGDRCKVTSLCAALDHVRKRDGMMSIEWPVTK